MNGTSHSVVKTVSMAIALSVGVSGVTRAQAPPASPLPTVEQQIAASVLALPAEMRPGVGAMLLHLDAAMRGDHRKRAVVFPDSPLAIT